MPVLRDLEVRLLEFLAWVLAFSLGNVTVVGTAARPTLTLSCRRWARPMRRDSSCLTSLTFDRSGLAGRAVLDEILVGCAVKGWKLAVKNSPGRASAMLSVECVTTGQYTSPSTITLPAATALHEFNAGMVSASDHQRHQLSDGRQR